MIKVGIWLMMMVIIWLMMVDNNLVGARPTPLKNDGVSSSVGMIFPFPTEWKVIKNKKMFQTTNQMEHVFGELMGKRFCSR